jgi:hypothetical protein
VKNENENEIARGRGAHLGRAHATRAVDDQARRLRDGQRPKHPRLKHEFHVRARRRVRVLARLRGRARADAEPAEEPRHLASPRARARDVPGARPQRAASREVRLRARRDAMREPRFRQRARRDVRVVQFPGSRRLADARPRDPPRDRVDRRRPPVDHRADRVLRHLQRRHRLRRARCAGRLHGRAAARAREQARHVDQIRRGEFRDELRRRVRVGRRRVARRVRFAGACVGEAIGQSNVLPVKR